MFSARNDVEQQMKALEATEYHLATATDYRERLQGIQQAQAALFTANEEYVCVFVSTYIYVCVCVRVCVCV